MSASPYDIDLNEKPIEWLALEQALAIDILGPFNPNLNETYPETIFDIAPGTKNGEIFLGPFLFKTSLLASMVPNPPMPDPIAVSYTHLRAHET